MAVTGPSMIAIPETDLATPPPGRIESLQTLEADSSQPRARRRLRLLGRLSIVVVVIRNGRPIPGIGMDNIGNSYRLWPPRPCDQLRARRRLRPPVSSNIIVVVIRNLKPIPCIVMDKTGNPNLVSNRGPGLAMVITEADIDAQAFGKVVRMDPTDVAAEFRGACLHLATFGDDGSCYREMA